MFIFYFEFWCRRNRRVHLSIGCPCYMSAEEEKIEIICYSIITDGKRRDRRCGKDGGEVYYREKVG